MYIENPLPLRNVYDTIDTSADICKQSSSLATRDSIIPTSTMNNNCNPMNVDASFSSRDAFVNEQRSTHAFKNGDSSTQSPVNNESVNVPVTDIEMQEKTQFLDINSRHSLSVVIAVQACSVFLLAMWLTRFQIRAAAHMILYNKIPYLINMAKDCLDLYSAASGEHSQNHFHVQINLLETRNSERCR